MLYRNLTRKSQLYGLSCEICLATTSRNCQFKSNEIGLFFLSDHNLCCLFELWNIYDVSIIKRFPAISKEGCLKYSLIIRTRWNWCIHDYWIHTSHTHSIIPCSCNLTACFRIHSKLSNCQISSTEVPIMRSFWKKFYLPTSKAAWSLVVNSFKTLQLSISLTEISFLRAVWKWFYL